MQTDREQVDATWKEYCDASKPTGVVHGTDVEEFDVDEMDRAAWELHQLNLTLLCERDAAEALAYERAAEVADDEDMAITQWGEDRNTKVAQETARQIAAAIRDLATSPNAIEEHDAKVRAEERERCARIAMKTEPLDADFTGVWTDYEHGADDAQKAIAAAIREQAND